MSKLRIIKPKNKAPKEDLEWEQLDEHGRVLKRPGMFIGSVKAVETVRYVYDTDTNEVVRRKIMYIDGLDRLSKEIISNAADNGVRSRQYGINPGEIELTMDKHTITVKNGGRPFSVSKFKGTDKYIIQVAYDEFGTSTNYDDSNRIGVAGMNGLGSKLTNTYSDYLKVAAVNADQKKRYEQIWTNNKFDKTEPKITPSDEPSYTQVTYKVDFSRFPDAGGEYNKDFFDLVAFDCLCFSFTTKIPVTFNGIRFEVFNPVDFAKMVYGETANFITLTETMKNDGSDSIDKVLKKVNNTPTIKYGPLDFALTDIVICDTPDAGDIISFANGMYTVEKGVHVDVIIDKIKKAILPYINKDLKGVKLTVKDLLPHISIIVSCYLRNPEIKGQMKSYLSSPKPKFVNLDPDFIENMKNWELIERLKSAATAKQYRQVAKNDGKHSRDVVVDKAADADCAGTKESLKCTLYITEGDSAKTYVMKMLKYQNGGEGVGKYSGVFPLRGKVKNLLKLKGDIIAINDNKEYVAIKQLMGFKDGVVYDTEEKIKRDWRYGYICIVTDADPDGKHIFGLNIGNLKATFPEFLKEGCLRHIRTPVIRAKKGKQIINFLTEQDYEKWVSKNPKGWTVKYCKGLGSSKDDEIREDSKDIKLVQMIYDEKASEYIDLALSKTQIRRRKDWLDSYIPYHGIEKLTELDISMFFDKEFIEHSIVNVRRSIPAMDGFKISQRKIFFTALEKWKTRSHDIIKTASLASATVERTEYHHGETSLQEAINGMVWDWTGSNNMPYFAAEGQFGSRLENGKDAAAARYTSVCKIWWSDFIFNPLDTCIYEYVIEDQEKVEPVIFYPILPMMMINGAWGVGTGYASFIPNYNPEDICNWILKRLDNVKELPKLEPWWKGFKGSVKETIQVQLPNEDNKKQYITKNVMEPDIVDFDEDAMIKRRAIIDGIYKEYGPNKVIVEEIPFGRSIEWYKKFLNEMKERKEITRFDMSGTDDENINIIIHGLKNPSLVKLKLRRAFGMTSMMILDDVKRPQRYRSAAELIEAWFQWRFPFFQKRLDKLVEIEEGKIKSLRDKAKLIEAILLGNDKGRIAGMSVVVIREPIESIKTQMMAIDLDFSVFKEVKFSNCTQEGLVKVRSLHEEAENNLIKLRKTTPTETWTNEIKDFLTEYKKKMIEENKKKMTNPKKKNKSVNKRVRTAKHK